jgi:RNA polymerase sigma-70 factor (ECF subfamily)
MQKQETALHESEAIERVKQGDIQGLAVLVSLYHVRAFKAACLITRNPQMAEDVVQAAFLKAYERISQLINDSSFGPWFLRSVVRDAIKAAQKAGRQVSLDAAPEDDQGQSLYEWLADTGQEEELDQVEVQAMVRAALQRLSPEQRAVIVLRYYLGLSEAEIGRELGRPLGTVKSRLHAARNSLRQRLC